MQTELKGDDFGMDTIPVVSYPMEENNPSEKFNINIHRTFNKHCVHVS